MSEIRSTFERDGFVVIPGFADGDACEQLRLAAEDLAVQTQRDPHETVFDTRSQSHGEDPWFLDSGGEVRAFFEPERDDGVARVNKIGHAMHDRLPLFDRFSRNPRLADLVAELGIRDPLLLQSMVIYKHPRVGGVVPAHQDATFLYTDPISVIGFWFALEPAARDNGCLEMLVGGHRLGLRSRYHRRGYDAWTEVLDESPWPSGPWRELEVDVGTLVAFHGLTPHRSRANRSSRSRCAYTLHVIDGTANYADDNWLQRPADMPLRGFV